MTMHRTEGTGTDTTSNRSKPHVVVDAVGDAGGAAEDELDDEAVADGEVYASDPVCGMDVAVNDAEFTSEVAGEVYYFCSQSCKSRFEKHPEKFT